MYSVIIPSIGRTNFIFELLNSIYKQTVLPHEIIIIFDENGECRLAERKLRKRYKLKFIFKENFTTPQKRNYGVKLSNSKYIIFSDDDDIWEINKAEITLKALKFYPVVCHAYNKFGNCLKRSHYKLGHKDKLVSLFSLFYGDNMYGGGSGIAARREILLSIPFNEDLYSEDYDWWIKIFLADIKVFYIAKILVSYRVHNKNMTLNFNKIYFFNIKIYSKNLIKSIILFFAFLNGFLRSIVKIFFKNMINILLFIKSKFLNLIDA